MNPTIRVGLESRVSGVGYGRAVIATQKFEWTVSERHFEEIHGLSRVVRLVPDKLATTFAVLRDLLPYRDEKEDFLINLVVKLCKTYEELSAARQSEDPLEVANCEFVFGEDGGVGNVDRESIDLSASVTLLKDSLLVLRTFIDPDREADYFEEAYRVVGLADMLREVCMIYLDFVYPVLITSRRRPGESDETPDQRFERVNRLLTSRRKQFEDEFTQLTGDR